MNPARFQFCFAPQIAKTKFCSTSAASEIHERILGFLEGGQDGLFISGQLRVGMSVSSLMAARTRPGPTPPR